MSPVKKISCSSSSECGGPGRRGLGVSMTAMALGLLGISLLASPAMAQVSGVTHQNPDYPSGPPDSSVATQYAFKLRNLGPELRNKMTGPYTVSSTGDLFFRLPVSQRMSPQLRDILRNADTTVGNLEGGVSDYPADRAKVIADLGF